MPLQLDIKFAQLVQLAKKLPVRQWEKLKEEVDCDSMKKKATDLEAFLLTAQHSLKNNLTRQMKPEKLLIHGGKSNFGGYFYSY